jgi:carboxylesterase
MIAREPFLIQTAEPFFFPGSRIGCLLVHGFTGTPKEMRGLGEHLAEQGHTVLGVRLSAHATQPEDMFRSRWWDWLACVEDGWHLLSGCTDRIFVLGLSMGGILSLTFSSYMPVAGLVAMATPHHLPSDPRVPFIKPLSLIQRFIPKGPPQWHDPEAYQDHVSYPADPTRAYAEVRQLLERMRLGLGRVNCPALLIYSKADPTVTAAEGHMEKIHAELGSQDKRTLWVENSGHVITRDADRLVVYQACGEFIRRVSQEGV